MVNFIKSFNSDLADGSWSDEGTGFTLIIMSVITIAFILILGLTGIFAENPAQIRPFDKLAPIGSIIWYICTILPCISLLFMFLAMHVAHIESYKPGGENRFIFSTYMYCLFTLCGAIPLLSIFLIIFDIIRYIVKFINFFTSHFLLLFKPAKKSKKTEKDLLQEYNNFFEPKQTKYKFYRW